ncbi:MAG: sulfotransferase [Roseiarcus sp.]|jgi:tetratricopeptide (TPR) repeat protein
MKPPTPAAGPGNDPRQTLQRAVQLHQHGRLDEAERLYAAILAKQPNDVDANHFLGALRLQQGRNDEAIRLIGAALKVNRKSPAMLTNYGLALERAGRVDEALSAYDKAMALAPDHAPAFNNRGLALLRVGRVEAALASFDKAAAISPTYVDALANRGLVLLDFKRRQAALASFDQALSIAPNHVDALAHRGRALIELRRPEAALASLDRALAINPGHVIALNHRGGALAELGRFDEALACFDRAHALRPDYAEALENKASTLALHGRMAEAAATVDQAIALAPRRARAYFLSTTYQRVQPGDRRLAAMEDLAGEMASLPLDDQINLNFALARAYRDLGDPERSFPRLAAGTALKRKMIAYDEARALEGFERAETTFTGELMRRAATCGESSAAPVFIVGMPRSGTTLIEQILASHPNVFAAGEIDDFAVVLEDLRASEKIAAPYPELAAEISPEQLRRLGAGYLQRLRALAPAAERITNKKPENFIYLGLIRLALPNAQVIHVRRDPLDTCFSCFSQNFSEGAVPYAYDLGELGRFYRAYETLMEHWRAVLPADAMIEVRYEDVVADLEGQARRLVAYCGLEWDPRCLEFHRAERAVRTASIAEVRQPIYATSIGRWRAYEAFLGPLREGLGLSAAPAPSLQPAGEASR